MSKDKRRQKHAEHGSEPPVPPSQAKLTNKVYDKELEKLHVELVKLQQWVVAKGLKVCIVFEGRDGAGKGGCIKAITERVSPRVFRVVALPAPTEREKSQMYLQRYVRAFPGGRRDRDLRPLLVQPRRGRAGDGVLHRRAGRRFPGVAPASRRRCSNPASSCSNTGWRSARRSRRAGSRPHRRRPQDLEAVSDGSQVLQPMARLFARARRHVRGDRHAVGAVVCRALRRQEAGAAERHLPSAQSHSL